MKVNVNFTIEVDENDWEANYGIPASDKKAIREDIKNYARIAVVESFNAAGNTTR